MAGALRCAMCASRGLLGPASSARPVFSPVASSSRSLLPSSRRSISFVPRKMKRRVSYKIKQIKWSGTAKGTTLALGQMGLRLLWPARIKQATFATMHQHLQRYTKGFKDVKIYWRRFPYRGIAEKGAESKMGKGRGTFSYYADAVPGGRVLVELSAPSMTRPAMVRALRAIAARCPSKCEIIDRYALPKVGLKEVPRGWRHPHSFLAGAHPPFRIVDQGKDSTKQVWEKLQAKSTTAATALPLEQITITQGPKAGQVVDRVMRTAPAAEWRTRMLQLYSRKSRPTAASS